MPKKKKGQKEKQYATVLKKMAIRQDARDRNESVSIADKLKDLIKKETK